MARSTAAGSADNLLETWFKRVLDRVEKLSEKFGDLRTEIAVLKTKMGIMCACIALVISVIFSGVTRYVVVSSNDARLTAQRVEIGRLRKLINAAPSPHAVTPADVRLEIEKLKEMIIEMSKKKAATP